MDPIRNPYSPGAGTEPPELAGRDALLSKVDVALQRISAGRYEKSMVLTGLRGVGKTVLLNQMRKNAESRGLISIRMEASDSRSLPSLLIPALRSAVLKLHKGKAAAQAAKKLFRALAHFASSMKLSYQDVEIVMGIDSGLDLPVIEDLSDSLSVLFEVIGKSAQVKKTALVLFVDELQSIAKPELAALIRALHYVAQDNLPVSMVAAGLPQTAASMGDAKTYAERLFEFIEISRLEPADAKQALTEPARKESAKFSDEALSIILDQTKGYPYFLQEWGKNAWDVATQSPITKQDAEVATEHALADLDASFFRVRFDQLTPLQKTYLRAMAELGEGPCRSGQISELLGKDSSELSQTRAQLVLRGIIYSPSYGKTAFTVPLFEGFMKRVMPFQ